MIQDLRIKQNREVKTAENSSLAECVHQGSTLISDIKVEPWCLSTQIFGFSPVSKRSNLESEKRFDLGLLFLFSVLILNSLFLIPVVASAATIKAPVINLGLVGHWTFDGKNITNGRIDDSSVSAYHGNTSGIATSTFYTRGKIGQAALFDGVNDYVNVPSPTNLQFDTGEPFSVAFWAKPSNDSVNGQLQIVGYTQGTTDGWLIVQDNGVGVGTKDVEFCDYDGTNYVCRRSSDSSFVNGAWYFVVATDDGTETLNGRQLYFNNVATTDTRCGGSGCTATVNINYDSNTFRFGVRDTASYWNGTLDDVRVYNRVLSAAEIKRLYNIGQPTLASKTTSTGSLSTGLVGHWSFDGKNITNGRIDDASGQANHGSATNIATSTFYTRGVVGQAAKFDGSDDYVTVPNTISTRSVSFQIKPTTNTASMVNLTATAYITASAGTITATGFTSPTIYVNGVVSSTLTVNVWNNVVVVGTASISANAITLGKANSAFTNGIIDDVRIYSRALSTAEIKRLYNLGRPTLVGDIDKYFSSVVLSLHMNGIDGSTTFTDSSSSAKTVTPSGNAQIDTAQSKFGGASGLFDGTGDYITVPASTDWDFGTGNFTIEFWYYPTTFTGYRGIIGADVVSSTPDGWVIQTEGSAMLRLTTDEAVSSRVTSGATLLTVNTWNHVALVRKGNGATDLNFYVNGVAGTSPQTGNFTMNSSSGNLLSIGRFYSTLDNHYINGSLDDLRITKGVARYTANFTPPPRQFPNK